MYARHPAPVGPLPARGVALLLVGLVGLVGLVATACGDEVEPSPSTDDGRLPWPTASFPVVIDPPDNPTTPEKVELGRQLFHDPIFSQDRTVACLTCHSPVWGMSDGLPVSVGLGGEGPIGTGRSGPHTTRRNSQALWNVAFRQPVFWDGRAATLEDQVSFPSDDPDEFARPLADVVTELATIPAYVELFEAAFAGSDPAVSERHVRQALAAFQRTIVSNNAPYDQYAAGDDGAMSDSELRGLFLFAELACHDCHPAPLFEINRFEPTLLDNPDDTGRFEVTGDEPDRNRFRVPSLRNARETTPYFHDGSVADLSEAILFEVEGRTGRTLDDEQLDDLVAFISKSLMDKSRAPIRPNTVPSGIPVPLDGYLIHR